MKRIYAAIICVAIVLAMSTVTAFASNEDGSVLKLPEDDGNYPITGINDLYSHDESIYKVIVPENIIRINERAFYACTNLNQIKLSTSLQRVGKDAFAKTAFYEDPDNWSEGVLYIGDVLIRANPDVISEEYHVKNGTRLIADGAFEGCKKLKSIILPKTVEYVGADALTGTSLMENKEAWVNHTFIIDHVLVSVEREYAGTFTVPDTIKTIADSAFEHAKITKVTTPDSLKFIGTNAFFDCQDLVRISFGRNVQALGRGPFRMCFSLKNIMVHEDNEHYAVVDGVLYNRQLSSVIRCPQALSGDVVLPYSVKKIDAYAFEFCEIQSITIPEGCAFIGDSSFSTCANLSNIILPKSLEYIDSSAFAYSNLESIDIPDNVYNIGEFAFSGCLNLKEVKIGDGVVDLKYGLFESCEKLNKVILGENIKEIDDTAFRFTKYIANVSQYQDGLLINSDKYLIKVAHDVTNCVIPSGITVIADGAFENLSEESPIKEIHVPSSVKKFNWGAFMDVPEKIPVYYSGSWNSFVSKTEFDWDCINLHTTDFKTTTWSVVTLSGVLILFVSGMVIFNNLKKHYDQEAETEDEYAEE